jgi:hypothetical protein
MCFVLYAGTRSALPRKEWQKSAPGPNIQSLTDHDAAIKGHFSNPEVQYIGSTSGCGCDFPHATLRNSSWPEIGYQDLRYPERAAIENENKQALVDLLRASGEPVVELYGVWDGDFADEPRAHENITIEQILDPTFLFKERGFYRVAVTPVVANSKTAD